MNKRIEKLLDLALHSTIEVFSRDACVKERLESVEEAARLDVIREEYAKVIRVDENSCLAGNYPTFPFWERRTFPNAEYEKVFEKYSAYYDKLIINGGNHKSANFGYVVACGTEGLMEQIRWKQAEVSEGKQKDYLEDLYFACEAINAWGSAHGDACRMEAEQTKDPDRKAELLEMAEICSRVPGSPARSFREAVQSYYFMFILFPDGLGRLDQYLYPFYRKDTEKGILTRKTALDLIEELFVKMFMFLGKDQDRSGNHHGVVGGYLADGSCGHNECTSLILEAVTELPTWRPQISYRVTAKTTPQQFQEVLEANVKRPDLVMFLNDDVIVRNLLKLGADYEDAVNYSVSGCNETILTGCSQVGGLEGLINLIYSFERLMKDQSTLESISDFETFYQAYKNCLAKDLEIVFRLSEERDREAAKNPDLVQSLFTDGCIESATSISEGGAKYNFCTWCLTGLVNLADSLSIIRQMVFEEKRFTLTELSCFLEADWNGYEKQRAYILNNGRYFGNDDDEVDELVNRIAASVQEIADGYTPYRGGRYIFGTLTGYEISHMVFGENSGATPDGRHGKDPFAASIAAYPGADKSGMTAFLKSAAKLDGGVLPSSVVVNLKLDRALADSQEKRARLGALFLAYFRMGGVQLQVNYLSADELIRAQQEPEKYRSLRVRVTGFSGFFTTFDKNLQDELIERSLHLN